MGAHLSLTTKALLLTGAVLGLLASACGALVVPKGDAGSSSGGGSGGASAGAGGGTGGGSALGGGAGGAPTGGGSGGGAVGGGTGGGLGDVRQTWPLEPLDAGTWTFLAKTPTQSQQPPEYAGVSGLLTPDGGALVWTADAFGDLNHHDGVAWTTVQNVGGPLGSLEPMTPGLVATSTTHVYACRGSCSAPGAFVGTPLTGLTLAATCSRSGTSYAVGTSSPSGTLGVQRFSGLFSLPFVSGVGGNVFGCHVLPDGTVLVAGESLWRYDPFAPTFEEEPVPGATESDAFWRGFVEGPTGEVYAFGTYQRVAHRGPGGQWAVVRQLSGQPDWLDAATALPSGELLFGGQRVSSTSFAAGSTQLLLLSEAGQAFFLAERSSSFSISALWAHTDRAVWAAGYTRLGGGSTQGAVFRVER